MATKQAAEKVEEEPVVDGDDCGGGNEEDEAMKVDSTSQPSLVGEDNGKNSATTKGDPTNGCVDSGDENNSAIHGIGDKLRQGDKLDLFIESVEATLCSAGIFRLADLRNMAMEAQRKEDYGTVSEDDAADILKLPIDGPTILKYAIQYQKLLRNYRSGDFEEIIATYMKQHNRPRSMNVYFVGDENADTECVHFVGRDDYRKVIMLVFRGSITPNDWSEDVKLVIDEIPNPLYENNVRTESSSSASTASSSSASPSIIRHSETVGIHWGFRNYLHGSSNPLVMHLKRFLSKSSSSMSIGDSEIVSVPSTSENPRKKQRKEEMDVDTNSDDEEEEGSEDAAQVGDNDGEVEDGKDEEEEDENNKKKSTKTKIQLIMEELRELKEKYPEDPIYITGHSLGGALALVASLAVASDPVLSRTPKNAPPGMTPVTVVAVANPKVGNRDFTHAIEHLERTHKLRCLCIHNAFDVVPMAPPNIQRKPEGFWHPGFRLVLYDAKIEIGRSDDEEHIHAKVKKLWTTCTNSIRDRWEKSRASNNKNSSSSSSSGGWPEIVAGAALGAARNRHDYRLYLERILAHENELQQITLNSLYKGHWKMESG